MSTPATVLLAGGDAATVEALRAALAEAGVRVLTVEGAAEAIEAARAAEDHARAAESENLRLREALAEGEQRVLTLFDRLMGSALPGAIDRGARDAALATRIAARFEIPVHLLKDLDLAARYHELGRVVAGDHAWFAVTAPESARWTYTRSTVALLEPFPGLAGVAEVVGNLYENWDGTGHPDHWLQGQIPLRCRILRVLIDLFAALESGGSPDLESALEWIEEHAGTRYDPMVVVHTRAVLGGTAEREWLGASRKVSIEDLDEGMVLAEDLYSESGVKLLARNTTLTPATLEVIMRRHRMEPLRGAVVLRKVA